MCGIFAYLLSGNGEHGGLTPEGYSRWYEECHRRAGTIKARGPERYCYSLPKPSLFFGFQRLAIVDPDVKGDQPFDDSRKRAISMCNGEIYNSKDLVRKYNFVTKSDSDCEVVLHMYLRFGLKRTLEELDGVFAFAIYDYLRDELMIARDPYGVRPLFIYESEHGVVVCSEVKGLFDLDDVYPLPGGTYWRSKDKMIRQYKNVDKRTGKVKFADGSSFLDRTHEYMIDDMGVILQGIEEHLTKSIKKRLQADRDIGCLLSGGLDSSLVASLVCKLSEGKGIIRTYSIGLPGSTDLAAARKVATMLGTEHHEIIFTEEEGLQALETVIKSLETWDVTTIRASTPMYLLAKYIKRETPSVKVIFSGEGADEVCQGYLYFHDAPTPEDGHKESVRLLKNLLYFDVLRSDRSTASHGLEIRVPFLDRDFVDYFMAIPPKLRLPSTNKCEKWLLRQAFSDKDLLPKEILWRKKEAFSDGVSGLSRSWYTIIQELAERMISDREMAQVEDIFVHSPPKTKEGFYFRKIFTKLYPEQGRAEMIPYQWMPRWQPEDVVDPSARVLKVY